MLDKHAMPGKPVNFSDPRAVQIAAREIRYRVGTSFPVRLMTWGEALLFIDRYGSGLPRRVDERGRLIPMGGSR